MEHRIQNSEKILILFINTFLAFNTYCQEIDCAKYYSKNSFSVPENLVDAIDEQVQPVNGYDWLINHLKVNHETSKKLFVRFVVDRKGDTHCLRVSKSEDSLLNEKSLQLIRTIEFIPAKQKGQPVVSTMILPVLFGPDGHN